MRSTEVAEPGDYGMETQLPRLGYRGRYLPHMTAAHNTSRCQRQPASGHHRMSLLVRVGIVVCFLPVLVYLCLQTDHARLKGMPMESWRLAPLILAAIVCALIGKRYINSIAGVFLGGIGGAFGTLDQFAGPYGGVVGLVAGVIVVAIPIWDKPQSKEIPVAPTPISTENAHTDR